MPTMTSSLCPTCGTPNPPHSLFCEKCGTRLIASLAEEPEEPETPTPATVVPKGLSLPTKSTTAETGPAAQKPPESEIPAEQTTPGEEAVPDWLQAVQSAEASTPESDLDTSAESKGSGTQVAAEEVSGLVKWVRSG